MDANEAITGERQVEGGWEPNRQRGGCGKLILLGIVLGCIALPFTPWRKVKSGLVDLAQQIQQPKVVEKVVEKKVEVPAPPPPLPEKFVAAKEVVVTDMWNGIRIKNQLQTSPGELASKEREDMESFTVSFQVNLRIPKPSSTLDELAALNPSLPAILPGLAEMLKTAKVSGFYHHIYEVKRKDVEIDISRLDKILSRHNFYDLETVLELTHPISNQKALLIQGEMDVVSDGSDGDRMADFDDYIAKSAHFQPTTSYFWKKQTQKPNPLLSRYEGFLAEAKEKAKNGATKAEKAAAAQKVEYWTRYITDLKTKSFLIAQEDPFIVIPLSIRNYQGFHDFAPAIGDYAVVICGEQILPAIVGDFGPREKCGEASLRIAKQIDPKASPYRRPVSDLRVTYLVFPGTAEKPWTRPDLAKWTTKCTELLGKIGGIGEKFAVHAWEDRFATPPPSASPPTPTPTPPTSPSPPLPTATPPATSEAASPTQPSVP